MSVSIYVRTIFGVKLPKPPYEEVKKRGCSHVITTEASRGVPGKFCGECGAKAWITEERPVKGYNEDDELLGAFYVRLGGSNEASDYYVGIHPRETGDLMYGGGRGICCSIDDLAIGPAELERELKKFLEPLGLWESDMEVGFWVFGYVSV